MAEIHNTWSIPVTCSPADAWPVVSDTDRLNRALKLGLSFEERRLPDGRLVQSGSIQRFGLTIRWFERDFAFQAPERFGQERIYDNGPVRRSAVACRVEPTATGCTLHYKVTIESRSFLVHPVVAAETRLNTKPRFTRVLGELGKLLNGEPHSFDPPIAPLNKVASERLSAGLSQVDPAIAKAIRHHMEHTPVEQQARIRPLAMARELSRPDDEVVVEFLRAVRGGALELTWEIICPSCKAPKGGASTLSLDLETHCVACDVRYDATFPDSVDVVFRPHRDIRVTESEVACLLSPARTPHVLLQDHVEDRAVREWSIELEEGGHRLDAPEWFGSASVEVRADASERRITADLTAEGVRPTTFRVRPGPVTVVLRNRIGEAATVTLEKVYRPPFTLTAGRLLELPAARELLPPGSVAPELQVTTLEQCVVALRSFAEGKEVQTHLRTFHRAADALALLLTYKGDPAVGLSAIQGPVTILRENDRDVPTGAVVDRALDLVRQGGGGRIRIDTDLRFEDIGRHADVEEGFGFYEIRIHGVADRRAEALKAAVEEGLEVPTMLGPYAVGEELGRGGMGRVLAAVGPTGEQLVVKTLLPQWCEDPEHLQRFYNEAQLTQRLQHPNIVSVKDYGTSDAGEAYLVMERIDGEELEARICRGRLPEASVSVIGRQMLAGLQAAHDAGVVHRDIKPQNVLVLPDDTVKLIDFGIAVSLNERDEMAARGVVVGSPRYMSPEQVLRKKLDGRSDLFSAAVVLFECLSLEVPFDGDGPRAQAMARAYSEAMSLAERNCQPRDAALRDAIEQALRSSAEDRPVSAAAMAKALLAGD